MALSGGVDSSVAAAIMRRAIGDRLHCFFIDNGLLRKDEFQNVLNTYHQFGIEVDGVEASEEFCLSCKVFLIQRQSEKS